MHVIYFLSKDFNLDAYAICVCNELRQALRGLVEEGDQE